MATVPDRDAALGLRVAALTPRLGAVAERLEVLKARDAKLLAQLAVSELASQKTRLQAYSVQARYALATLYDRAAVSPAQSTNPSSTHPDTAASP